MALPLIDNFEITTPLPIEKSMQVANITERNNIPSFKRYQGMFTYVVSDGKYYSLVGGITNSDWFEWNLSGGGGSGWSLEGNEINLGDALGTINNEDLVFVRDGIEVMRFSENNIFLGYSFTEPTIEPGSENNIIISDNKYVNYSDCIVLGNLDATNPVEKSTIIGNITSDEIIRNSNIISNGKKSLDPRLITVVESNYINNINAPLQQVVSSNVLLSEYVYSLLPSTIINSNVISNSFSCPNVKNSNVFNLSRNNLNINNVQTSLLINDSVIIGSNLISNQSNLRQAHYSDIIIGTSIGIEENLLESYPKMNIGGLLFGSNLVLATVDYSVVTTGAEQGRLGICVPSPKAVLELRANNDEEAALRFNAGSTPTTPNNGDIWFDGTDLKMHIGGITKTFQLV